MSHALMARVGIITAQWWDALRFPFLLWPRVPHRHFWRKPRGRGGGGAGWRETRALLRSGGHPEGDGPAAAGAIGPGDAPQRGGPRAGPERDLRGEDHGPPHRPGGVQREPEDRK